MKKSLFLLYALLITVGSFAADTVMVNRKVIQAFEEGFPNAQEVTWTQLPGAFQVSFVRDGIRSKASYRNDGILINFSRYYQEDHLPSYILMNLKEQYPGQKVFGVTELTTNSASADNLEVEYYVKLGNDKEWITVRVNNDGEMTMIEKFKKTLSATAVSR